MSENNQSKRSRPISHRLKQSRKNKPRQVQKAKDWAWKWRNETLDLLETLNETADKDWDTFDNAMTRLLEITRKKHEALQENVFDMLATPVDKE